MDRGRQIAEALRETLPQDYPEALSLLLKILPTASLGNEPQGMEAFYYLPLSFFIQLFGSAYPEESLEGIYQLTKVFTGEFCIRPFIMDHQELCLERLQRWTQDEDLNVRRLVSEGTRPRLPWAPRLPRFQRDPSPILPLLEALKDDPELYVRRSVANNLNDISKDHPQVVLSLLKAWKEGASSQRLWLINHALRGLIKGGNGEALALLGYHRPQNLLVENSRITPQEIRIGERIKLSCTIRNQNTKPVPIMVDGIVHFVKASGERKPKVFKLKKGVLPPGGTMDVEKTIRLESMTTRKHYPGVHKVELMLNGIKQSFGDFNLRPAAE